MITQNIKSVGIELEGGINSDDLKKLKNFVKENNLSDYFGYGYDYSVNVSDKDYYNIEIRFWHYDLNIFFKFIEYVFNECRFKQNETCGNHIHLKFVDNEKALSVFSYKKAWEMFLDEYKKYAYSFTDEKMNKYLKRLQNKYCLAKYNTKIVIKQLQSYEKNESRYRAINLNSYNLNKTIEIRILPYFNSFDEAKKSIEWLIKTIDKIYNIRKSLMKKFSIDLNVESNSNNNFDYTIKRDNIKDLNMKIKIIKIGD
jgi:hypothetical protein